MRNGARTGVAVNWKLGQKTANPVVKRRSRTGEQKKCKSMKSPRLLYRRIIKLLGWALKC